MKYFLTFSIFFFALRGNTQNLSDSITYAGFSLQDVIAEKLSNLAINNYQIKIANKEIDVTTQEISRSKAAWLNNISVSGNLNEYSLKSTLGNSIITPQLNFYPRYNINLSLPLGFIMTRMSENKIAKINKEKSIDQRDKILYDLKQQIKTQYQLYLSNKYLLAIHESTIQDDKILFERVQTQFDNNQVDLEVYSSAVKKFNDQLTRKISLLRDFNASRYALEGLLGMDLNEAIRQISNPPAKK